MDFFTASVSIEVKSAKMKSELDKAKAVAVKSAKEQERLNKVVARNILKGYKSQAKEAERANKAATRAAEKAAKAIARAHTAAVKRIKRAFRNMSKDIKASLSSITRYAKYAGAAILAFSAVVVNAAMKQEDALFLLDAALKISGEYTDEIAEKFRNFAAEMQRTTIYGDEFVLQLMQQQKSLGVTADSLEDGARMAIGLATATGQGIESMSRYVALAMQGEFTMLRRYIPALRATTDATEQLAIVQQFAADGFKLAEERSKTTSGALRQMWNALGDVAERIGNALIPTVRRAGDTIKKWAQENQEKIEQFADAIAEKFEWLVDNGQDMIDMFVGVITVVGKVAKVYVEFYGVLKDINEALVDHNKGLELEYTQNEKLLKIQKERIALGKKLFNIAEGVLDIGRKKPELGGFGGMGLGAGYKNILKKDPIAETREELPWGNAAEIDTSKWKDPSYAVTPAAPSVFGDNVKSLDNTTELLKQSLDERQTYWDDYYTANMEAENEAADQALANAIEAATTYLELLKENDDLSTENKIANIQIVMDKLEEKGEMESEAYKLLSKEQAAYQAQIEEGLNKTSSMMKAWARESMDLGTKMGEVFKNVFEGISDNLTSMLMDGKAKWADFGKSIIRMVANMIIKLMVAALLMAIITRGEAAASGAASMGKAMQLAGNLSVSGNQRGYATGGHVAKTGNYQLHQGEKVVTKSQMASAEGTGNTVNIINQVGPGITLEEEEVAEDRVVNIIIKRVGIDGPLMSILGLE